MSRQKPDQSFDSIAEKFQKNIYGKSKGRLRHELLLHYLTQRLPLKSQALSILDAGGGTGMMSKEMLSLGHQVLLNDLSEDALQIAREALKGFEQVEYWPGKIQDLAVSQPFDLVICHAVLEWLNRPLEILDTLVQLTSVGGYISLSFFNRHAQKFGNVLYGNFDYVEEDLPRRRHVRMNPHQALEPEKVIEAIGKQPLEIVHQAGIRCFHDYLRHREQQETHYDQIKRIEIELGTQEPYLWFGKYFHLICRRVS